MSLDVQIWPLKQRFIPWVEDLQNVFDGLLELIVARDSTVVFCHFLDLYEVMVLEVDLKVDQTIE